MTCHCCCRGKLPFEGFATMWRISLINGEITRVYDRGANSVCLHVVEEGGERYIYEGGAADGSEQVITKWHDGVGGATAVWSHVSGVTDRAARSVAYQPYDGSVWYTRFSSTFTDGTILRVDDSDGAEINYVAPSGLTSGAGLALASDGNGNVSLWSTFTAILTGKQVVQWNSSLTEVASLPYASYPFNSPYSTVPLGKKFDPAQGKAGWGRSIHTASAHHAVTYDGSLTQTNYETPGVNGSVIGTPIIGNTSKLARTVTTSSGVRTQLYTISGMTQDWSIAPTYTGVGADGYGAYEIDSSNNVYVSGGSSIYRLNGGTGATDWTYNSSPGPGISLINDRDVRLISFGGTHRVRAIDMATGSLLWSQNELPATLPGRQIFGQYLYVCGNRTAV